MARAHFPSRGENHYKHKLKDDDISLIIELANHRKQLQKKKKKITNQRIAEKFGVTASCVEKVISGARR